MMSYISSTTVAALLLLSATSSSAFVQVNGPSRRIQSLQATETFQRSLLEAQLKLNAPASSGAAAAESAPIVSVDYDAAARLTYVAAGSSGDFEEYKVKYLEETSAMMAKKNPYVKAEEPKLEPAPPTPTAPEVQTAPTPIVSVDYDATARLAYGAAGKPGDFEAFKTKYLEDTSAMMAKKNPYIKVEELKASEPKPEPVAVVSTPPPAPVPAPAPIPQPAPKAPLPKTEFTVPRELALVPINEASVQFTAGLIGATAGFLIGGPILSAILAAASNYLSRKDEETSMDTSPKKIVDTASQTALLLYNFLAKFEKENKVVDTTFKVLEGAVDKVKATEGGSALLGLESTLGGVAKKVEELNDDYDLVQGAGTVLNSVGDLVEISVDKVVALNEEYQLTDRVSSVVKGTVDKLAERD